MCLHNPQLPLSLHHNPPLYLTVEVAPWVSSPELLPVWPLTITQDYESSPGMPTDREGGEERWRIMLELCGVAECLCVCMLMYSIEFGQGREGWRRDGTFYDVWNLRLYVVELVSFVICNVGQGREGKWRDTALTIACLQLFSAWPWPFCFQL